MRYKHFAALAIISAATIILSPFCIAAQEGDVVSANSAQGKDSAKIESSLQEEGSISAVAQENGSVQKETTVQEATSLNSAAEDDKNAGKGLLKRIAGAEAKAPVGWSGIPLPIMSFDSTLGFQFGVCGDFFDYADTYPDYRHRINFEASHYTGGQSFFHAQYDSEKLIPNIRLTASASFQIDPFFHFYGLDGISFNSNGIGPYDESIDKKNGLAFYDYSRNMLRILSNFQGTITGPLNWNAGINFWYMDTKPTHSKKFDPGNSLYVQMRDANILSGKDLGGCRLELKAGISVDTRDNAAAAQKGFQADAYLTGSPDFFSDGFGYLKISLRWRHYLTLIQDRLVFAYHLGWQQNLAGKAPFYMQSVIYALYLNQATTDGLGGINTLRGVFNSRLLGEGYAWTNMELRLRLFDFNLLQQHFSVGANPFFDAGMITKAYKIDELSQYYGETPENLRKMAHAIHCSAGGGLKLTWNRNFILSFEGAAPFRRDDGRFAFYVSLNYIF